LGEAHILLGESGYHQNADLKNKSNDFTNKCETSSKDMDMNEAICIDVFDQCDIKREEQD
jgi:hypothetical protein